MSHHAHLPLRARRIIAALTCAVLATMGLTVVTGAPGTAAVAPTPGSDGNVIVTWNPTTLTTDNGVQGRPDPGDTVTLSVSITALIPNVEPFVIYGGSFMWWIAGTMTKDVTTTYTRTHVVTEQDLQGAGGSGVNLGTLRFHYHTDDGLGWGCRELAIGGPANFYVAPEPLTVATSTVLTRNGVPFSGAVREGDAVSYTTTLTNTTGKNMTIAPLPGYGDLAAAVVLAPDTSATFHRDPITVTIADMAAGAVTVPDAVVSWNASFTGSAQSFSGTNTVTYSPVATEAINTTVTPTLTFTPEHAIGQAQVGDEVAVNIDATNNGNVTMQFVRVRLGRWATGATGFDNWNAALAPGASLPSGTILPELLYSGAGGYLNPYILTAADVDRGYVDLDGKMAFAPSWDAFNTDRPGYTQSITERVFLKDFTMQARAVAHATLNDTNGDGIGQAGETVTYQLRFRNNSNQIQTITGVQDLAGSDLLGEAAVKFTGKQIAIGDVIVKNWTHTLTASDEALGAIAYGATVAYTGLVDGDTATRSTWAPSIPTGPYVAPATTLGATATYADANGDGKANPGERVTVTVKVANTGTYPLTGLAVTNAIGSSATGALGLLPTTLTPGSSATLIFTHDLTPADKVAGTFTYGAVMMADGMAPTASNPSVSLPVAPLPAPPTVFTSTSTFTDVNGDGKANAGETATVTVKLVNTGTYPLEGLAVTDAAGADATGALLPFPVDIAAGASAQRSFTRVLTAADEARGTFGYSAVMTAEGLTGSATSTVAMLPVVRYAAPATTLAAAGTYVDANGDGKPSIGEKVTVTVTATNTGTYPLTGLAVTDAPGANVTGLLPAFPATIAPGVSASQSFTYVLKAADYARGSFGYAAKMTADGLPAKVSSPSVALTGITFQAYATDLDGVAEGGIEVCTADGKPTAKFAIFDTIGVKPTGCDYAKAASGYRVVGFSTPLTLGADTFSVKVPVALGIGAHRMALYRADGSLVGWKNVTVTDPIAFSGPDVDTGVGTGVGTAAGAPLGTAKAKPLATAVGGLASTGSDAGAVRGTVTTAVLLMLLGAAGVLASARRRGGAGA